MKLIIIAQTACEIKGYSYPRLFDKIGKPPTKQSIYNDNDFKSEVLNSLGYFFAQNKITPRSRSPPKFRFYLKNKKI